MDRRAWQASVHGIAKSWTRLSVFTFTFHLHALEKAMATHSSVLAWRIPGMVEPGGLPSMGSHRVGHDWSDLAAAYILFHWSGPPVHSQLVFCMHICVWRCIPDVPVERDVPHVHLLLYHLVLSRSAFWWVLHSFIALLNKTLSNTFNKIVFCQYIKQTRMKWK